MEDWRSKPAIVGTCPDMCPEKERGIRETIEDLDPFERVNGSRCQTSKSLALKKYTRTAETIPELIRPLPVCEASMEHMRNLLSQPYDSADLLGLHRFLWDRMRAVRMDLRMQHLFGHRSIIMHEQMIRFHILVMHELCEHSIGQGLDARFDAHLNIEQLNRTFSDLFEMYDDHTKAGMAIPKEPEFRSYYVLLKMSSHPGFNVLPNELSKDLIKMKKEIRSSMDVKFAMNVAKSFRTDNYVSFFRLVEKATYLQACLMHAHFNKVRFKALCMINSSLSKQGGFLFHDFMRICAIEEEDALRFIEHHGARIRELPSKDTIIIKSSLQNQHELLLPKKSNIVKSKRSKTIVMDVIKQSHAKSTQNEIASPSTSTATVTIPPNVPHPSPSSIPSPSRTTTPRNSLRTSLRPSRIPSPLPSPSSPIPPSLFSSPRTSLSSQLSHHPIPSHPPSSSASSFFTPLSISTSESKHKNLSTPMPSSLPSPFFSSTPSLFPSLPIASSEKERVGRNLTTVPSTSSVQQKESKEEKKDSIPTAITGNRISSERNISSSTSSQNGQVLPREEVEKDAEKREGDKKGMVEKEKDKGNENNKEEEREKIEIQKATMETNKKLEEKKMQSIIEKNKNVEEEKKKMEMLEERKIQARKRQNIRYILRSWKVKAEESKKLKQKKKYALENISLVNHFYKRPSEIFPSSYLTSPSIFSMHSTPFPSARIHLLLKLEELRQERNRRKEAMFAPIDIFSLLSTTLYQKNNLMPCVCWKISICSRIFDSSDDLQKVPISLRTKIGQWLRIKLSNLGQKDQMSQILSKMYSSKTMDDFSNFNTIQDIIYKNRYKSNIENDRRRKMDAHKKETQKMLWFMVKDMKFDEKDVVVDEKDAMDSSAIIFILMDGVSIEDEKKRLVSVVRSIPDSKSIPLLILAFKPKPPAESNLQEKDSLSFSVNNRNSDDEFTRSNAEEKEEEDMKRDLDDDEESDLEDDVAMSQLTFSLGLFDPEFKNISSCKICFMKSQKPSQLLSKQLPRQPREPPFTEEKLFSTARENFLDDAPLIEGLQFLAETSEKQPEIVSVSVADLLQRHLDLEVSVLKTPIRSSPNLLIRCFNQIIRRLCEDIRVCDNLVKEGHFPNEIGCRVGGDLRKEAMEHLPRVQDADEYERVLTSLSSLTLPLPSSSCSLCSDWSNHVDAILPSEETTKQVQIFSTHTPLSYPSFVLLDKNDTHDLSVSKFLHPSSYSSPSSPPSLFPKRSNAHPSRNTRAMEEEYSAFMDSNHMAANEEEKMKIIKQFELYFHYVWHYMCNFLETSFQNSVAKSEAHSLALSNCSVLRWKGEVVLLPRWHSLMMQILQIRIHSLPNRPPLMVNVPHHLFMDVYYGEKVQRGGDILPNPSPSPSSTPVLSSSLSCLRLPSFNEFMEEGRRKVKRVKGFDQLHFDFVLEQNWKSMNEMRKKRFRLGAEEEEEVYEDEEEGMDKYLNDKKMKPFFPFPFEIEKLERMKREKFMAVEQPVFEEKDSLEEEMKWKEKREKEREEEEMKMEEKLSESKLKHSQAMDQINQRIENAKRERKEMMETVMNMAKERNERMGLTLSKDGNNVNKNGDGDDTNVVFLCALRRANRARMALNAT